MKKEIIDNAYVINKLIDILFDDIYFNSSYEFFKSEKEKITNHFNKWEREMIMPNMNILGKFKKDDFIKLIEKLHRSNYDNGLLGKGNYLNQTEKILVKWERIIMGNNNIENNLWVNEYENKFRVNQI